MCVGPYLMSLMRKSPVEMFIWISDTPYAALVLASTQRGNSKALPKLLSTSLYGPHLGRTFSVERGYPGSTFTSAHPAHT